MTAQRVALIVTALVSASVANYYFGLAQGRHEASLNAPSEHGRHEGKAYMHERTVTVCYRLDPEAEQRCDTVMRCTNDYFECDFSPRVGDALLLPAMVQVR